MNIEYSTLTDLFLSIVQKNPHGIAIKDCQTSLTYLRLYQYSCRLSEMLIDHGVRAGDRVVCVSKKNTESIVCFWSILMSGGIPVMLDHEDGPVSNEVKIRVVAPRAIIMDKAGSGITLTPEKCHIFDFCDLLPPGIPLTYHKHFHPPAFPDVCYILLTSGTTGYPKAVQITHGNVLHYVYSIYETIGFPDKVNALHASTFAADLGLTNLLVALISCGTLRILNRTESGDPAVFNEIIERERISLLKITPSHLLSLVSNIRAPYKRPIDTVILGGEKLSWETASTIHSLGICTKLYNHYGPTETTIGAIAFSIHRSSAHFGITGSVPLGQPLGEGSCFFENATDNIGELCISGPGVSIGYWDNEIDNNKKFFLKETGKGNVPCYRTGDICKKLEDGNYEFLYRIDRQVKINGYRVEPGEIELQLAAHPDVENVNVETFTLSDHTMLDAYIKPIKGKKLTASAVRNWLSNYLPRYKMPSNFYFYTEPPTTSNGKIDLKALVRQFKAPKDYPAKGLSDSEDISWSRLVTDTWCQLLDRQEIADSDNFYETGGDSILAIQFIGRLQRHGYQVNLIHLKTRPTFGEFILAVPDKIFLSEEENYGKRKNPGFMTLSQRKFLGDDSFETTDYLQSILLETANKIDLREMAIAINCILQRHVQLTRVFDERTPGKKTGKDAHEHVPGISILDPLRPDSIQIQDTVGSLSKTISPDSPNLFVSHVFIGSAGKDYLYLACHHLAVDAISWNIILYEMLDLYEQILIGASVPCDVENIVDGFYRELSRKKVPIGNVHLTVPREIFRIPDEAQNRHLPNTVESCHFVIPEEIIQVLKNREEYGVPANLAGVLLNALGTAILDEFSVSHVSIDLEFHGRPHQENLPDLSNSVAWWAVTMPVHLKREDCHPPICSELIERAALIANKLNLDPEGFIKKCPGRADIRFNYLGYFPRCFENSTLRILPSFINPGSTRSEKAHREYKFYFTARFLGEKLIVDLQYQADWFEKKRVRSLIGAFLGTLASSIKSDATSLARTAVRFSNLPSIGLPLYNVPVPGEKGIAGPKTILLTGASGFLGSYLLRELTENEQLKIYCLIRGEDQGNAERRLEDSFRYYFDTWPEEARCRVEVMRGDLLAENMGMSPGAYETIAHQADLILHCAADINLTKEYSNLERVNVDATRAVVQLALTGKKKEIHYISTLAVSGYSPDDRYKNFSEKDLDYGQSFVSGYERSKFESEKLVRRFFEEDGKGKIYRVGHIAADSILGKFQKNLSQNRIFQIINGIITLKMLPQEYEERLSFSYVDIVARGIIGVCTRNIHSEMNCMHIENPQYIPFSAVVDLLLKMGYSIEWVPTEVFRQAVATFDGSQHQKKIVDLMSVWVQRAIEFPRRVNYIQKESSDLLAGSGLYFPKPTLEWFANMIKEGVKAEYFESPSPPRSKIYSYEADITTY